MQTRHQAPDGRNQRESVIAALKDAMRVTQMDRARAAKLAMRAADRAARQARKTWTGARTMAGQIAAEGEVTIQVEINVGAITLAMWSAEAQFAACVAAWRDVLAEREAMPVADRWSLAGLDKWARAQEAKP
jgi:hypothetical protein